ncbi:unnamed protein product [Didymodactylos carnosus]|uniref:F-box domain-containing protein n=1 Tax=Didymodactylos carnosus TaxID=1234261 RepID=A0A815W6R3_9BILA|nr:unnamed protein product [Didymodactylos carnosus]CAF1541329.1 unnamed protein product [Didymodactylos carnosus]CAF4145489.1 unnamed protein product [Didymodactylos carnosus]CAF4401691.1 unnamed protein product [Didymodactylos carnosus]
MLLENLPDELFLKIFHYLSHYDLIHALYNLNTRLNNVTHSVKISIDLTPMQCPPAIDYYTPLYQNRVTYAKFLNYCQNILPNVEHHLISLKLSNRDTANACDLFNTWFEIKNYSNIEILTLTDPSVLMVIKLKYLEHLTTLYIEFDFNSTMLKYILCEQMISLKKCTLINVNIFCQTLNLSEINKSNVEILSIDRHTTLFIDDLFLLFHFMPKLKHLECSYKG